MTTQQARIDADKAFAQRFALEAIRRYLQASEQIKFHELSKSIAGKLVKDYLADMNLRELHDGEMGLVARLQDREGQGAFDFGSMTDADILMLARAGCFGTVSKTALAAISKSNPRAGETAARFLIPGPTTTALIVSDR